MFILCSNIKCIINKGYYLGVNIMSANSNHTKKVYMEEVNRPFYKEKIKNKENMFFRIIKKLKHVLRFGASNKERV